MGFKKNGWAVGRKSRKMSAPEAANPQSCKAIFILNTPPLQRTHIESISDITFYLCSIYKSPPHPQPLFISFTVSIEIVLQPVEHTSPTGCLRATSAGAPALSLYIARVSHSLAPAPSCLVAHEPLSCRCEFYFDTQRQPLGSPRRRPRSSQRGRDPAQKPAEGARRFCNANARQI